MSIFDLPTFVARTISLGEKSVVITAPETWSDNACTILYTKYFRKAGIPSAIELVKEKGIPSWLQRGIPSKDAKFGPETSATQVFRRLAGAWAYHGLKGKYFTAKEAEPFYHKVFATLANQVAAPNSPSWFNVGLYWAYGIEGDPSGGFYFDDKGEIHPTTSSYEHPQGSACFINHLEDSLMDKDGLMDLWVKEARVFKGGSGSGANYSNIRGLNEPLSHGGKSSGLMSFLKVGDASAGAIKSGGVTRRAARMVVLDVDHPEVEEFIDWKMNEETKVAMLDAGSRKLGVFIDEVQYGGNHTRDSIVELGLKLDIPGGFINRVVNAIETKTPLPNVTSMDSTDWQSEAYQTVSGQNANNSVSVSHEFMKAVDVDEDWVLKNRTDGKVNKCVKAKHLWDKISYAAWSCADPGLHFNSTMNDWHTTPNNGRIRASNPCSELVESDNNSCNLASINLKKFIYASSALEGSSFDFDTILFTEVASIWTSILDITVGMSQYPAHDIALETMRRRTLGLGFSNLGGMLMHLGIPYDSDEGRYLAAGITALLHSTALRESALIAKKLGAFPIFENNKKEMLRVISNHHAVCQWYALGEGDDVELPITPYFVEKRQEKWHYLFKQAHLIFKEVVKLGSQTGFRNSQVSLLAPCGTISLVMDNDTSGIEPDYSLLKFKTLAGGGHMFIVNQSVAPALKTLGYSDQDIVTIQAYIKANKTIEGCPIVAEGDLKVFDCATFGGVGNRAITPMAHVLMMAAVQPFLSGAISKTVNLPNNASLADVSDIYKQAYRFGIKAIALYRDGSKLSQPLMSQTVKKPKFRGQTEISMVIDEVANFSKDHPGVPVKETGADNYYVSDLDIVHGDIKDSTEVYAEDYEEYPEDMVIQVESPAPVGRHKLPNERRGVTVKASVGGHKIYIHTGEYEDGKLGEIFLDMSKEGATMRSIANNFAIAVSIGLQHGVPLEEFVDAFTFTRFEPSGLVTGHNRIKRADSFLDYVFRDLAIRYLGKDELAHVAAPEKTTLKETLPNLDAIDVSIHEDHRMENFDAKFFGFTGDLCSNCGQPTMVRNGTCLICKSCGQTTGCS